MQFQRVKSTVELSQSRTKEFMNIWSSQDEISVKLLAGAATDEVLVSAAKAGDRPAFAELWERHSNTAFNMAYRVTKNLEDAECMVESRI